MTKREAVKELKAEDIRLLAEAALASAGYYKDKEQKRIRRAVKILRAVKAAQ